ncbi:DUF6443 domain-containing protein [Lutibacter sp.]|uniref:DUF6443 domain-containing protein n=1 Tax=Lutibacter sp. TaxID=1925666 RepID=UPI0025BA0323|nr:DUF6443 domain-containing protein [Lutibacter sp.]MCF6168796.1 DUF6443 domain-containing protein [Lutibacter sp.]
MKKIVLKKMLTLLIVMSTTLSINAQRELVPIDGELTGSVAILGGSTANVGDTLTYGIKSLGVTILDSFWSVTGGVILSQTATSITVEWTSVGTGIIDYTAFTNLGVRVALKSIVVAGVIAPDSPPNPIIFNETCTSTTLKKSGLIPSNEMWYWQGSIINGTSISYPATSDYIVTTSGNYYIRSKNTSTGLWSLGSGSILVNTLEAPTAPVATVTQPTCTSIKAVVSITSPTTIGNTYSFDNGITYNTNTLKILPPGIHYLKVKNSAGCESVSTLVTINAIPTAPSQPIASLTQPTCSVTTGSITIVSPTTAGNTYSFDNGVTYQASTTKSGLTAGTYYLKVKNSAGCISVSSIATINSAPTTPSQPIASLTQPTCSVATGSITIVSPTTAGNTYSFDNGITYQASTTKSGLTAGTYYLKVKNSAGCISVSLATLNAAPEPSTWYADADGDSYGNINSTTNACNQPIGYVANNSDYNDTTVNITNIAPQYFYYDSDGDGFGDPTVSIYFSVMPSNYVTNNTDNCPDEYGTTSGCDIYAAPTLSDENYVYTRSFQTKTTTGTVTSNKDVVESITYFDGLGRTIQNIGIKQSATQKDIITHVSYDDLGRKSKEYLPYAASDVGVDASYRANALISTNTFYNTEKYEYTTNPYSEQLYDGSPLNLVVETAAPGNIWKEGILVEHTIKNEYKLIEDADLVYNFQVSYSPSGTPSLVDKGLFTIGAGALQSDPFKAPTLYKFIIKNENWSENQLSKDDNTTHTFKDYRGRTILSRTFESNVPHDTYYVYDTYGNLSYVITPNVDVSNGVDSSELSKLCYQYKYDGKNRLIEKQLPGKEREYVVYDQLNRPILTQDALQKVSNQWLFTKYDAYERVVYTGVFNSISDRAVLQSQIDALVDPPFYETKGSAISIDGATVYYSNNVFPNTAIELLTISYYDDYNFDAATNPSVVYGENITIRTKGLATGSKVKVLDQINKWIITTTYYDSKANPVYIYSVNDYLETTDVVESDLDFVGKAIEIKTTHNKTGQSTITMIDYFDYDHAGRLKQQSQVINNSTVNKETIVENTYDELGQLISKGVGGLSSLATRLQSVNYTYNIRGWLKQINDPTSLDNDLFGFKIGYTDGTTPLFNGNISNTQWNTQSAITGSNNISYNYNYSYDALNRITSGIDNTGNYNLASIDYDKNGNILHLNRTGNRDGNATVFGEMDNLSYFYTGNQLHSVTDTSVATGFNDANTKGSDYSYDANGNMITDLNKGISITYNYLNLPKVISNSAGSISYTYDANGTKLSKEVSIIMSASTTTQYAGNYVYSRYLPYVYGGGGIAVTTLQFFNQSEGYVEPEYVNDTIANFNYIYQYKDHLSNIRLSYADLDKNGIVDASEILEENNYYPFGLKHKGYNSNITSTNLALKKKFGGNEYNDELGLNWYDVSARNYDPALGRWFVVDALADAPEQIDKSPYQYAWNNPIRYNDPDGNCPSCIWGAVIGAAVDYGLQVTSNLIQGKDLGDALTEVDGKSILLSAGAGALSGGISSISKLKQASTLVKLGVEVATDTGISVTTQAIKDGDVSLKNTIIDVSVGQIIGKTTGNATGNKATNSTKGKQLKQKVNEQKNIARGKSNKTSKSKANVNKAQKKLDGYVSRRATASSATASGAASKGIEKYEEKKKKEDYQ